MHNWFLDFQIFLVVLIILWALTPELPLHSLEGDAGIQIPCPIRCNPLESFTTCPGDLP